MLKNTAANLKVIRKVALALGSLNKQVVYVGGATVSFYINDPAAEDVRPTKDLDISLDIATLGELEAVRGELVKKGFNQTAEDNVICRFRYEDIKVDVMNTKAIGWAPANPWFEPGFAHRETVVVEDQQVQILPLSYFLASKFNAFCDRGAKDPRISHDFEDIIYVIDNRTDFVEQLRDAPSNVKSYLIQQMQNILHNRAMQEAIYGNLFYETRETRYQIIIAAVKQISNWG
jgi:predicted nucleotidyltransferase